MPRTNYVIAWNNLKDLIASIDAAGVTTLDTSTILSLMSTLEHSDHNCSNLDELIHLLCSPQAT